jgi:transcriptional regulator with XRE-family HTH domain
MIKKTNSREGEVSTDTIVSDRQKAIEVGNKVREIRKRSNLTMKELADAVGVSILTIQRIETGKLSPSVVLLSEIAYHLRYPMTAFIAGEQHVVVLKGSEKNSIESNRLNLKVMAHRGEVRDDISVTIGQSDVGEIIGRHKNNGYELTYIIKGKNILRYGNKEYPIEAGDIICHDGKDWHSVTALEPTEFLNIYFFK